MRYQEKTLEGADALSLLLLVKKKKNCFWEFRCRCMAHTWLDTLDTYCRSTWNPRNHNTSVILKIPSIPNWVFVY